MASIQAIRRLDQFVGAIICSIIGLLKWRRKPTHEKPKKILLIQLWGIGETILALPTIRTLRERFPDRHLTMLTTSRVNDVFYANPYLDETLLIRTTPLSIALFMINNWKQFDLVIDMEEYLNISAIIAAFCGKLRLGYQHGIRSRTYHITVPYNDKQHVTQTFLDLLIPLQIHQSVRHLEQLNTSEHDRKQSRLLINQLHQRSKLFLLAPGTAESAKIRMWSNHKWSILIRELQKQYDCTILLVGAKDVTVTNEDIIMRLPTSNDVHDVSGQTTLREFFAIVEQSDLVISIDSGPMHIGAAQRIPTIGLFGPNTPVRFGPYGENNIAIYKPVADPIINVHRREIPNRSSVDHMQLIEVAHVIHAVQRLVPQSL